MTICQWPISESLKAEMKFDKTYFGQRPQHNDGLAEANVRADVA